MLNPLPKEVTDEIRFILEGIQSGQLKHEQRAYHSDCGTAHCVAGWKQILDYEKLGGKLDDLDWVEYEDFEYTDCISNKLTETLQTEANPENYAREKWNLSYPESYLLFNVDATLPEQFALLELLERGERIENCVDQDKFLLEIKTSNEQQNN